MSSICPIIYIIDDDDIILWVFKELLRGVEAEIRAFTSARDFLDAYRPGPHECLICDLRMPEIGGLEVQQQLLERGSRLPIILVSGYSEIPSAVQAIKNGAFDFLEKPVDGALLVDKVQSALARSRQLHAEYLAQVTRDARLALLTAKERQVAELVAEGKSSPKIAQAMNISVRTVENHRAHLMEKLHVESIAELVKLFL
jgi:FixJ family two-component response regulator